MTETMAEVAVGRSSTVRGSSSNASTGNSCNTAGCESPGTKSGATTGTVETNDLTQATAAATPTLVSIQNSNAFQERTFRACTYFDNPSRQRLKSECFKIDVLLAANEALLKTEVPSDADAKEIVSNVLATFEKNHLVLDATEMLGLDPRG